MYKLSVSNIAWAQESDVGMYQYLTSRGYVGLEIAPTRIFPFAPYDKIVEAQNFQQTLFDNYGLNICSMQSIWYGHRENIFGSVAERKILADYTKKAINFAKAIKCCNLVFGCPKNRIRGDSNVGLAIDFFSDIAQYAVEHGVVIALEANPTIYGTDFINTTAEAFSIAKAIGSAGLGVNLDIGTMIENKENISMLFGNVEYIHHIHISEPFLEPLKKRRVHHALRRIVIDAGYEGYVSLEMKNNPAALFETLSYFEEVFA